MQTWIRSESVVFWKTREPYGWLSNMCAGYPIEARVGPLAGRFPASEHLYIAMKYRDPARAAWLLATRNPIEAKRRSHAQHDLWFPDWDDRRLAAMREVLLTKFRQHRDLARLLLQTGDRPIVEASSRDQFWGATPPTAPVLHGENHLGLLLMDLRAYIRDCARRHREQRQ